MVIWALPMSFRPETPAISYSPAAPKQSGLWGSPVCAAQTEAADAERGEPVEEEAGDELVDRAFARGPCQLFRVFAREITA